MGAWNTIAAFAFLFDSIFSPFAHLGSHVVVQQHVCGGQVAVGDRRTGVEVESEWWRRFQMRVMVCTWLWIATMILPSGVQIVESFNAVRRCVQKDETGISPSLNQYLTRYSYTPIWLQYTKYDSTTKVQPSPPRAPNPSLYPHRHNSTN